MRLKILLFAFLLWGGVLSAQEYIYEDTIKSLVITETRLDNTWRCYLELTNMGDEPVQLNQFKIGYWFNGSKLDMITGQATGTKDYRIPVNKLLPPGESYVFASIAEFGPRQFAKGLDGFPEKVVQDNMWEAADFYVRLPEIGGDETDLITEGLWDAFSQQWGPGMNGFYIEQHFANGDSVVIDQVNGMFLKPDGTQHDRTAGSGYDIAGVSEGTGNSYLIRKASVKQGNLDFFNARGLGLEDSEWIPIPIRGMQWRLAPWTVGNHGDYKLDYNTLESNVIEVDFVNKTLTVPWGVRRGDDIMSYFEQKPGIGWDYILAPDKDSLSWVAQTGDKLDIYVCGNDLDFATFNIVVKEPAADANMVVPVTNKDPEGGWRGAIDSGILGWPRITKHESGNDTIWGIRGGIPYATRVDSLVKRLEKPSNAEWEIVYASGDAKPDLAHGDKLKVTAQNGSVKEYFISVNDYRPNNDATLSSITWPDIPDFYKGIFGWIGDTIPGFGPQTFNYSVEVPLAADGIPALVVNPADINAKVDVSRATSLSGSVENRTIKFKVTAESDTTENVYNVELSKEKNPDNIQPNHAEPFISEYIFHGEWRGNSYLEICNPGNQTLDLSDYMFVGGWINNPADAIGQTNETNWLYRYTKYIPGYKWQNQANWAVQPYIAETDLAVNAIVYPGDVFVMGAVNGLHPKLCDPPAGWNWPALTQLDVQFKNTYGCYTFENPWGEEIKQGSASCVVDHWSSGSIYMFKIDNDSIKKGLKPATDPNDFTLIDVLSTGDDRRFTIGGEQVIGNLFTMRRKPQITKGNPLVGGSFGNTMEESEWILMDWIYGQKNFNFPMNLLFINEDMGKHYFNAPTQYMSTVSSVVYKVSEGYQSTPPHGPQTIRGITTGTTVNNFLDNIIKADEGQSLTLTSNADGTVMVMDALLSLNDTLTVLSADSINTTKYVLDVSEEGLSSDAVLTSARYEITIDAEPKSAGDAHTPGSGSITGFEYGTTLQTVVNNVTVPAGATMNVISGDGAYVPFKQLNYDTAYVSVTVNDDTWFEVIAENGITTITYQLLPTASASSAFVLSDVYSVRQSDFLIDFVPRGSNVQSFLSNLVPSLGATMKLVDKWGFERTDGGVADDDRLLVTSADGTVTVTYHIGKLATEYVPANTYLAYILSNVYGIDQVEYKIHGASGIADISEFYARIRVAQGATAVVVDSDGNEKTTGDINGTDMVRVTSADGKIVVMYTFGPLTDANAFRVQNQMEFYPNPTSGILNVSGVQKGQRVQVYNAVGTAVLDIKVNSNREVIPLHNEPAGMYLIVVSDKNNLLGKYKAIKY